MGKVTAMKMDPITDKSGHQMVGMAVSVCTTPAAPSPIPIPTATIATAIEVRAPTMIIANTSRPK